MLSRISLGSRIHPPRLYTSAVATDLSFLPPRSAESSVCIIDCDPAPMIEEPKKAEDETLSGTYTVGELGAAPTGPPRSCIAKTCPLRCPRSGGSRTIGRTARSCIRRISKSAPMSGERESSVCPIGGMLEASRPHLHGSRSSSRIGLYACTSHVAAVGGSSRQQQQRPAPCT